jgi:hypothetical protein
MNAKELREKRRAMQAPPPVSEEDLRIFIDICEKALQQSLVNSKQDKTLPILISCHPQWRPEMLPALRNYYEKRDIRIEHDSTSDTLTRWPLLNFSRVESITLHYDEVPRDKHPKRVGEAYACPEGDR